MYRHILIATDGSELATKGVEQGLALAKPLGARVTVLTVTEPLSNRAIQAAAQAGLDDPHGRYERQMDDEIKKLGEPVLKKAAELGITVEVERDTDEFPAEAIIRSAKRLGCDLIVMSSHGRRGVSKLLLGSQTSEVLTHTSIPVLVIK